MERLAQLIALLAVLAAGGCTTGVGLAAGPTVDRGLNKYVLGSNSGKTLTSDDDDRRKAGDTAAASRCQVYDLALWPLDIFYLAVEGDEVMSAGDHCARWNTHETKELAEAK